MTEPARGGSPAIEVPRRSRSTPTPRRSCSCSAGARATGALRAAVRRLRDGGWPIAHAHFHHLNPLPAEHRRGARALPRVLVAGDERRPAGSRAARRSSLRRRRELRDRRAAAARGRDGTGAPEAAVRRVRREHPRGAAMTSALTPPAAPGRADQGRLPVGPVETRWCPGCGDYAILAAMQGFLPELGHPAGADRVRLRDRLRGALLVLHEHLRDARHPRPRAGARNRARGRARPICRCGS